DSDHRRMVLNKINYQFARHQAHILELDVRKADDVASIRAICRSLGVRPLVRWADRSRNLVDIEVNYDLSIASGVAWFTAESAGPDPLGELQQSFANLTAAKADDLLQLLDWLEAEILAALRAGLVAPGVEDLLRRIRALATPTREVPGTLETLDTHLL